MNLDAQPRSHRALAVSPGAPAVGAEVVPTHFLPRLFGFWREGRFRVERMMSFYDVDQIDQAAHDAESGAVIKPVLRMS